MKILKMLLMIIIFLAGYAAGNFIPWNGFGEKEKGITGPAKFEVTLLTEDNKPVVNLEVDVAEKPGPPLIGGSSITNENGVATFNIKPGNYFVYFNSGNFPQNLEEPKPQQVQVNEENINKETIVIKAK